LNGRHDRSDILPIADSYPVFVFHILARGDVSRRRFQNNDITQNRIVTVQ
jgi:hypothetical protein